MSGASLGRSTAADPRDHRASKSAAIGEHGDARTVRKELAALRAQRRELPVAAEKREAKTVAGQSLRHVAAVDEAQLEQAKRSAVTNGERPGIEAPHERATDAEVDDDADPQPHPDVLHAERPRRQEHERRMVSWCGPPRRRRDDVESPLRAGQRAGAAAGAGGARSRHRGRAAPAACPRSERVKPARDTSTSSVRRLGFRTVTAAVDAPRRVRRSGVALRPMPPPAAAPGMDAAAAARASAASALFTCRSP